jgi:hypothetical protein
MLMGRQLLLAHTILFHFTRAHYSLAQLPAHSFLFLIFEGVVETETVMFGVGPIAHSLRLDGLLLQG